MNPTGVIVLIQLIIILSIPFNIMAQTKWTFEEPHVSDVFDDSQCLSCHLMATGKRGLLPLPRGDEQEAMCKTCHNETGNASTMPNVGNHFVIRSGGDNQTIDCSTCHNPHAYDNSTDPHNETTAKNLKLIRKEISTDFVPNAQSPVIFQQTPTHFAFMNGNTPYSGVCQSCHTETTFHRNDGSG